MIRFSRRMFVYSLLIFLYIFGLVFAFAPKHDLKFIYFESCHDVNCTTVLYDLLVSKTDYHCAFYDLKDPLLLSILNSNTLVFEDNYDESLHHSFQRVGSKGLMHHKFCVFDDNTVLTGSWNPTFRGTTYNDNAIVILKSTYIAQQYLDEYYRLIGKDTPTHTSRTIYETKTHDSWARAVLCRQENCEDELVRAISSAQNSIKMLSFTFTNEQVAQALLDAHQRGVNISVVFEKTKITTYSVIDELYQANISVFVDTNPYTMHHKLLLIDNNLVIAGSYNPTKAATLYNDENMLFIKDPQVTIQASEEIIRVQALSQGYNLS